MYNSIVLLQAAAPSGPAGIPMTVYMMVGMLVIMYFFMIRPQAKRAKEQKKFAESIAVNEQIITTAGIHGRINRMNEDDTIQLEISRGTFMTIDRSAVSMEMTLAFRKKADAAGVQLAKTAA